MGKRKKKKNNGPKKKPWCFYCERVFDNIRVLCDHQKAKHFKCSLCARKLSNINGLVTHCLNVHKEEVYKVPNALASRESLDYSVFGMEGIPIAMANYHPSDGGEAPDLEEVHSSKRQRVGAEGAWLGTNAPGFNAMDPHGMPPMMMPSGGGPLPAPNAFGGALPPPAYMSGGALPPPGMMPPGSALPPPGMMPPGSALPPPSALGAGVGGNLLPPGSSFEDQLMREAMLQAQESEAVEGSFGGTVPPGSAPGSSDAYDPFAATDDGTAATQNGGLPVPGSVAYGVATAATGAPNIVAPVGVVLPKVQKTVVIVYDDEAMSMEERRALLPRYARNRRRRSAVFASAS